MWFTLPLSLSFSLSLSLLKSMTDCLSSLSASLVTPLMPFVFSALGVISLPWCPLSPGSLSAF